MPDTVVSTERLLTVALALAGVEVLSPPPTPKGRYVLAKAAPQLEAAARIYYAEEAKLIAEHAKRDESGAVIAKDVVLPNGSKGRSFDLVDPPAFNAAKQSLLDEPVTLIGVRPITRAELGACPITVQQEKWLLGVLLADEEPAE